MDIFTFCVVICVISAIASIEMLVYTIEHANDTLKDIALLCMFPLTFAFSLAIARNQPAKMNTPTEEYHSCLNKHKLDGGIYEKQCVQFIQNEYIPLYNSVKNVK